MNNFTENFGSMVFGEREMKEYLSEEIYNKLQRTVRDGRHLDLEIATPVADAMKEWAISKGATHFSHWFQPLTGVTAEKHDSFVDLDREGKVICKFSGKELIKGESDASSFPSGGLRATFEARGYTAWDPTSYAFVKGNTLYIPTAFCAYGGQALDKKTPLLRSMEKATKAAMRVLRMFGNEDVKSVKITVGAEQEYFLVPTELFEKRRDLIYTGRTLVGARPPKGQELDDHYYGSIKPEVAAFMAEVDSELWKLGVPAKTEHNEAAPAQHELASVFTTVNLAADSNQLTMEILRTVAKKHGFVCLLHEKPFAGVNGSGKHNNWSMSTDAGANLLEPGDTPSENAQFLLFLTAIVSAIDSYPELLRISVAGAGNDHRLGGNEAPPAIISVFLGDEITEVLDSIVNDTTLSAKEKELLRVGVHILPKFPKDSTDRNRTSPIAFTGNKFEFRMPGAPASISDINTVINTAVAEKLNEAADALENSENFEEDLHSYIKNCLAEHGKVIFNGNGYGEEWKTEAEKRGLPNLPSTPDALHHYLDEKNVGLMTGLGIFTVEEMASRREIMLENYIKVIRIEALTLIDMVRKEILPAVSDYRRELTSCSGRCTDFELETANGLAEMCDKAFASLKKLEKSVTILGGTDVEGGADFCSSDIVPLMKELRTYCDGAELITSKKHWPYPSYGELLLNS